MERVNSNNQLDSSCEKRQRKKKYIKETLNNLTNLWRHFRSFSAPSLNRKRKKPQRSLPPHLQFAMELSWNFFLERFFFLLLLWADRVVWDISIVNSSSTFRLSCENAKIEKGGERKKDDKGGHFNWTARRDVYTYSSTHNTYRKPTPQLDSAPKIKK